MVRRMIATRTVRLLEERRQELLGDLRRISPEAAELVQKLEETLDALREHTSERGEFEGLDRPAAIRKYLERTGHPADLREIRNAIAAPASRFDARSIWDGGKREVEQGRLVNVADDSKGEDWVLALPEWRLKRRK